MRHGDTLAITVLSSIPDDNTTIHWHGISQLKTNWADGVPGMTQARAGTECRTRMQRVNAGHEWGM